jgi:5-hydroxyisourate hydrolase-like protein (transthyretin family)
VRVPFRFRVFGVVTEAESGRPLPGLAVHAFDKDVFFDDALGTATTDADGRFEIAFTTLAFRDVREGRPDLYFRVYAAPGARELHSTRDRVLRNAKSDEDVAIAIPRAAFGER